MAVFKKFKPPPGATFHVVAEKLFNLIGNVNSKRVDVVFDVYLDFSIKTF